MRTEFKCFVVLAFVSLIAETQSNKCTSLKDVLLMVHHRYGDPYNITSFSGCIERVAFDDKSLTEIYIRNQNVMDIGEDTIRNMVRLKTVVFWGCPVQSISVGAFRNVPRLQNVQISYGNLTIVPAEVFSRVPALQLLRLNDNKISTIEEAAFSNLTKLKRLHMAKNELTTWNTSWFVNTTDLEIIDFQKNKIKIIPRLAFHYMTKLKELYFDYNEIKTIEPQAFECIRHLDYLGLRLNRLTKLDEKFFPKKISVRSLLIGGNYLNYLSDGVLNKVSVREITLDGNPWNCACLDKIHRWLHSTNATLRTNDMCAGSNIPSCAYSSGYGETCTEKVDKQLTKSFIETLKTLKFPLDQSCARLD